MAGMMAAAAMAAEEATTNVAVAYPAMPMPILTPLPEKVAGVASPVLDLNVHWQFAADERSAFKPINVPGEWAMQGFTVKPGDFAIYKRTIDVPGDWSDKTIKLRFDAVHAVCKVSVNARDIGGHEGGFVPFELDATQAIHPGRNEIIVRVQSESVADSIACISQYAAHQVGGIVRKVRLFCVPELHISEQWVETQLTGSDAVLQVHTKLDGSLGGKAAITHHLLDKDHKIVATARSPQPLLVPTPHLWTSETPYLYTLETTIGDPKKPTETLRQRIGLREIKVAGNQMFINGHPVKLLGVCRHEVHPLLGRSLTPALCRKDAELYRSANINLVRTSHYPPSEEFLTACDELGIFVECEAAVCWIKHGSSPVWNTWNHLDPKYLPYFMRANLDNVAANRNHPSVILWSLANESLWSPLFAEVLVAVKQADPTRPVTFHDQCWGGYNNGGSKGDLANYHYPAENNPDEWSQLSRPVWFGEYAHLQCYNRRELVTDPGIRDDWGRPLARMVDLIWQQPGCLGGAIWSGIDDVFHLPNGDLKGYGHWGPIDGWRREKPEYNGVYHAYSPIRILKREVAAGKPIALTIQNRFNFTDLADVDLAWKCGPETGKVSAKLAPHDTGEIIIYPKSLDEHRQLILTATDRRGVVVAREVFATGSMKLEKMGGGQDARTTVARASCPDPASIIPVLLPLNGEGGASGPAGSVLVNEIAPFTPVPADWSPQVTPIKGGTLTEGESADAKAKITIAANPTGGQTLTYELTLKKDINPRQWGLVFTLPRSFDTLTWQRNAPYTWYPADHVGRPQGSTKANPVARKLVEEPGVEPKHPWSLDANALGTADFRSTRANIEQASLSDGTSAFTVRSPDASQAIRAWVDGDCIRLFVAGFNTGGSDGFFAPHYAAERRPLKKGDVIRSSFEIGF
jgi:hypothetical protein